MRPQTFHALVRSLEALGRRDPRLLAGRVTWWIILGGSFLLGVVIAIVAAVALFLRFLSANGDGSQALIVGALMVLVGGTLAAMMVKWWFTRNPAPTGERLDPRRAPALWQRVTAIQQHLGAPPVHSIVIGTDCNAAVFVETRIGPYLRGRVHLMLGLPLLIALDAASVDAVIAHELAHTRGPFARIRRRLDRAWRVWGWLDQRRGNPAGRIPGVDHFVEWFVPRLSAHSIALSRLVEFESDRASVVVTDARVTARTLLEIEASAARFGDFWEQVWKRCEREPEPPADSWSSLRRWFDDAGAEARRAKWLEDALRRSHLVEESHPSLRLRLDEVGWDPAALSPSLIASAALKGAESGAATYLAEQALAMLHDWDAEWRTSTTESWAKRHEYLIAQRTRFAELSAKEEAGGTLTPTECWEAASILVELEGDASGLAWVRRAVDLDPANAPAQFVLGRALLAGNDPAGITHLERAMEIDVEAVPAGTAIIRSFHAAAGDAHAARHVDVRAEPQFDRLREARAERSWVSRGDKLVAPSLSDEERARLLTASRLDGVRRLWVVRKETRHDPGRPLTVVLLEPTAWALSRKAVKSRERLPQDVYDAIGELSGGDTLVQPFIDGEWLRKRIRSVGGLLVDPRRGTVGPRPLRWDERHRMKLGVGLGVAAAAAILVLLIRVPTGMVDPDGRMTPTERSQWDRRLYGIANETDVDLRVVVGRFPDRDAQAARATEVADELDLGFWYGSRGLLLVVDAETGSLLTRPTSALRDIAPARFLREVELLHAAGWSSAPDVGDALDATVRLIHHRLRESSLRPPVPARVLAKTPSEASVDELRAGATPREALESHRRWLSLPAPSPVAPFLTAEARRHFGEPARSTPARWALRRHLYADQAMHVEARGDVAIAFAMADPLVPPLYLRRGPEGWQLDLSAGDAHVAELLDAEFAWTLIRRAGPYDGAFEDAMVRIGDHWRFARGANAPIVGCGCGG